jgi:hypothetical protein
MKKIYYLIALISLMGIIISGCSKAGSQASIPPVSNNSLTASSQTPDITQQAVPLTISQPSDGASLTDISISVQGQTEPGAVVQVNDETDLADAQGNFSIPLDLVDGINYIDVIASDENGNEGEVLLSVEVDQNPDLSAGISGTAAKDNLTLTVSEPMDNGTVTAGEVVVRGKTSPQAIVGIGDQAVIAGDDGSFSITVNVEEGPAILAVIASNDNGDEVEVLVLVNAF